MQNAHRLFLVTVPTMASSTGALRMFARARLGADWKPAGPAEQVDVGSRGIAWGEAFHDWAAEGEPRKIEGDHRTPAGIYNVGRPFGFEPSSLKGYLQLQADSVCVEDPASPAYNTITSGKTIGHARALENMRMTPLYRRGLIVEYPTDRETKAGSCIFLHIWKGPAKGTAGCVTMPEERVAVLQKFADEHPTVVAVVPETALARLNSCLSSVEATAH